jgi:endonuclease/exonuclease/phosphatase family metal-dependent hydrolase
VSFYTQESSSLKWETTPLKAFTEPTAPDHLKLLSFNIQVGITASAFYHYFTNSWQHVLPSKRRMESLKQVAAVVSSFDLVALQEVDGGSFRSGFINQVEYLAQLASIPHWYQQLNRNLGPLAQHSNGVLSRIAPSHITEHKLPGRLPGRGAISLTLEKQDVIIRFILMHLALGKRCQMQQLGFVRELIGDHQHVVLMGDMNTHAEHITRHSPLKDVALHAVEGDLKTYPSWAPQRGLDHILISESIPVKRVAVLDVPLTDHLPVAVEIAWPKV